MIQQEIEMPKKFNKVNNNFITICTWKNIALKLLLIYHHPPSPASASFSQFQGLLSMDILQNHYQLCLVTVAQKLTHLINEK